MGICGSALRSPTANSMTSEQTRTPSSLYSRRTPMSRNSSQEDNFQIPNDSNNKRLTKKHKGVIRIVTTASLTNKLNIISDEEEGKTDNKALDTMSDKNNSQQTTASLSESPMKIDFDDEVEMIEDISNETQQKGEESAIQKEAELDNNFEEVENNNHDPWISFKGKKALVTGAGKGIGNAVAIKLAECGAEVIAVSRIQSDLNELEKSNGKIKTIFLDVGDWEETKSAITNLGHIDLLVNNASVGVITKFGDIKEEDIDETYNVNLKAIINISQIVVKGMKERGKGGSIVNVSSMSSFQTSNIGMSIYSSSKSSVDQLTRCMALELGPHHIRVNAVKPEVMRTQMSEQLFDPHSELGKALIEKTPLKRLGTADEVAFPILFLLSDYASFINGVVLTTDGGLTTCFQ